MGKKIAVSVLATVILASVHLAEAQAPAKVYRIGFLAFGSPPSGASPSLEAFRHRLRELGYVEGVNLVLERRYAKGKKVGSQAKRLSSFVCK